MRYQYVDDARAFNIVAIGNIHTGHLIGYIYLFSRD